MIHYNNKKKKNENENRNKKNGKTKQNASIEQLNKNSKRVEECMRRGNMKFGLHWRY